MLKPSEQTGFQTIRGALRFFNNNFSSPDVASYYCTGGVTLSERRALV